VSLLDPARNVDQVFTLPATDLRVAPLLSASSDA